MLNTSSHRPSQPSSSSAATLSFDKKNPSSLLSSAISFNYSSEINTPPCLMSSDDDDDYDEQLYWALIHDDGDAINRLLPTHPATTDSSRATNLASLASNDRNNNNNRHSPRIFSAAYRTENMAYPAAAAQCNSTSTATGSHHSISSASSASLIPRPNFNKLQQTRMSTKASASASESNAAAESGRQLNNKTKNSAFDVDDDEKNVVSDVLTTLSSVVKEPTSVATARSKKIDYFLMTGNVMVHKTASSRQFLPQPTSSLNPQLLLVAEHENQRHLPERGSGTVAAVKRDLQADSAIPTTTTTSSFNDDDDEYGSTAAENINYNQRKGRSRRFVDLSVGIFREPSSNSSAGDGNVYDIYSSGERAVTKKHPAACSNDSNIKTALADNGDNESGIDLPKVAWPPTDGDDNDAVKLLASRSTAVMPSRQPLAGHDNHLHNGNDGRGDRQTDPASSFLSLASSEVNGSMLLHETDILDAEPLVMPAYHAQDSTDNRTIFDTGRHRTDELARRNQKQLDFVSAIAGDGQPKMSPLYAAVSAPPNENNVLLTTKWDSDTTALAGCPLPDILNNCRYQQQQQQRIPPTLGWADIESVSGDTIAVASGAAQELRRSNYINHNDERRFEANANYTLPILTTAKSLTAPGASQQQITRIKAVPEDAGITVDNNSVGKKTAEDRPVWTFNAPPLPCGIEQRTLERTGAPSPAPIGSTVTATRSVPASPATYRRAPAGGGSWSSAEAAKRIGRGIAMATIQQRGGDNSNTRVEKRSTTTPRSVVTVMPFLRFKPFDTGRIDNYGGGVTPHNDNAAPAVVGSSNMTTPCSNDATLKSLARSLYYLKGCTPVEVADHIVEHGELRDVYLNLHNFSGLNLEIALRQFLEKVCLMGAPQQKTDLLERFARRFYLTYDEEFETWLSHARDDTALRLKPYSTVSSLTAAAAHANNNDGASAASFVSGGEPQIALNNNSDTNKLFVSIRTTLFASLALVIVSSYFYQQQLDSSSASRTHSVGDDVDGDDNDDDDDELKQVLGAPTTDIAECRHRHVRERHAAGSRHPRPGYLDHLPSISAYTVRHDDAEEDCDVNNNNATALMRAARATEMALLQQQHSAVMTKSSGYTDTTNNNSSVSNDVIRSQNVSKLTSTDANRYWDALFNELLPQNERVSSREQKRLKAAVGNEPLPVRLTQSEVEFLLQYACRYEPPPSPTSVVEQKQLPAGSFGLADVKPANFDNNNSSAGGDAAQQQLVVSTELFAVADADDDDVVFAPSSIAGDAAVQPIERLLKDELFVKKSGTAEDGLPKQAPSIDEQLYGAPFKTYMQAAAADVIYIKQQCGPHGAHLKWWRRRWHRRLVELRYLTLVERRIALARKPIDDPKRQRMDADDVVLSLHHAWVERPCLSPSEYAKRGPFVLQLFLHDGTVRMLRCDTEQRTQYWLRVINTNCAFSAPVKVPVTNDPACLPSLHDNLQGHGTPRTADHRLAAAISARSDIGPYYYRHDKSGRGDKEPLATFAASPCTAPRFFPDAITTFNERQQLAELRDYLQRCERDLQAVQNEEAELRQTRTLSLHGSLRRSARRHTQRLLEQRSGALLLRRQLLATELRRTRVYIDVLEQLVRGDGGEAKNDVGVASTRSTAAARQGGDGSSFTMVVKSYVKK